MEREIMVTQSVRNQLDNIKNDVDNYLSSNKVSPELKLLLNTIMVFTSVVTQLLLEKKTKKGSKNSDIPPSQTFDDHSTDDSETKKRQEKKKKNKDLSSATVINETTQSIPLTACPKCGHDLSSTDCCDIERRVFVDIVYHVEVKNFDAEKKLCPACNASSKSKFPEDIEGPLQYGLGIKAFIINMIVCQMVSLSRLQTMLSTMIGYVISQATMLKYVLQLHNMLEKWELDVKSQLLNMKCINTDETSMRVDKKNFWIHSYSSGDLTLKFIHPKRGGVAIKDIGILEKYGGIIVHDCYSSYFALDKCGHGLCGSHLLRELTYIIESTEYSWASKLKGLLQDACHKVNESKSKTISDSAYRELKKNYDTIVKEGWEEMPDLPVLPKKQGKIPKPKAYNLLERLEKYRDFVLLFSKNPDVPFTNNRAEQDIRMAKVKKKVSGCFRTIKYAEAYCRISSYLKTMSNQGISPIKAIEQALTGEIYNDKA